MIFNSLEFAIFYIIILVFLFIMPAKWRVLWLLAAGYYFFMSWNMINIVFLIFTSLTTYLAGRYLDQRKSKVLVAITIIANVAIIISGKYFGLIESPIGVSFYTLMAIGYIVDVYRGKREAEKNYLKYSLFVAFFPLLQSGPIERSTGLLSQISQYHEKRIWNIERIKSGFWLIVWGLFLKLVIADRASVFVEKVYGNYTAYGTVELLLASILFSIEIYCDFAGYSNIAIGLARIMGFDVMQNFKQPYLAVNIKDFWRRWHISLTSWFTDYVYIPLGGNRKGVIRKYINIIIVFDISGIWHGKSMNFLAWGLLHAILQIMGDIKNRHIRFRFPKVIQILITFIMVNVAWIFFAADSFTHALGILRQMLVFKCNFALMDMGLMKGDFIILIVGVLLVLIVDILRERGLSINGLIEKQFCLIRWGIYSLIILIVIVLGIYGVEYDTSSFMYIQF